MTRESAKQLLPIIEAWSNGETLQSRGGIGLWQDYDRDHFPLNEEPAKLRIKPKPRQWWMKIYKCGSIDVSSTPFDLSDVHADTEIIKVIEKWV